MVLSEPGSDSVEGAREFRATHWSVVLAAGDSQSPQSAQALETLCRAYWFPLYAFVRRRGFGAHEAQDLTQSFFAQLLERKAIRTVNPSKGKFRSFLLAAMQNFLNNEWDKASRLKRGGGAEIFSLDAGPAEERYQLEPVHNETSEKVFDRRWAQAVLTQVAERLRDEFVSAGHPERFAVLKDFLMGDSGKVSYDDAAQRLELSVSAVTSAIHRMRTRFRDLFRAEIAQTVASPDEVDEEIRHLLIALSD